MTNLESAEGLRRALARLGARGRGRRYPHDLRERVLAYARERSRGGESTSAVAAALGLNAWTLTLWLRAAGDGAERDDAFRAIVVSPPTAIGRGEGIVVETRSGVRVTGLALTEVVALLRSLA